MTLEEYSEWVLSRHPNATLTEAVLGLVSEAGEVAQVKRKHMAALDEKARADMIEELGDTLHYMVRLAGLLGVTLAELAEGNVSKLEMRDQRESRHD